LIAAVTVFFFSHALVLGIYLEDPPPSRSLGVVSQEMGGVSPPGLPFLGTPPSTTLSPPPLLGGLELRFSDKNFPFRCLINCGPLFSSPPPYNLPPPEHFFFFSSGCEGFLPPGVEKKAFSRQGIAFPFCHPDRPIFFRYPPLFCAAFFFFRYNSNPLLRTFADSLFLGATFPPLPPLQRPFDFSIARSLFFFSCC